MVAQPTASNGWCLGLGHSRHDQRQATESERQRLVQQEEAATRHSHSRRRYVEYVRPTNSLRRTVLNSTATHLNGSTSARSPTTPVDNQQRHTHGRQRVSSPVRQLRLTLGLTVWQLCWRLLGYFHSPTQLSFLSSVLITLCLVYTTTVSQFINSKNVSTPLSNKLSIAWLSQSPLHWIWFNSTRHALVPTHLPARSHEIFAPARLLGRGTRHKLWTSSQRQGKRPIEGRSLHTITVDRKSGRDRLLHSINLILFTLLLVHLSCAYHLITVITFALITYHSLDIFTPDLKLICFINPFLRSHSYFFRTASTDLNLYWIKRSLALFVLHSRYVCMYLFPARKQTKHHARRTARPEGAYSCPQQKCQILATTFNMTYSMTKQNKNSSLTSSGPERTTQRYQLQQQSAVICSIPWWFEP